ncbi:SDR family NAD(P)-dependent oxidoreductase [Streptomyces caniferus]|uniref:SDR family NAD(P)-dependent oxidoreductase n=1 Tax=Streptomyces caniferus TaxID=285557 RepID=UPI00371143EA
MGALTGKAALVTGGTRGIGRAISKRLARDGALVAVHYGSNRAAARETVADIEAAGNCAFALRAHLGSRGDAEQLWSAFEERMQTDYGESHLDILVNNAGVTDERNGIAGATRQGVEEVLAVNVTAPFFIVQQGLERLRDGGRIINISSAVTRLARPSVLAYSMSKRALDVFTRTLALELGKRHITAVEQILRFVRRRRTSSLGCWVQGSSNGGPQ